MSTTSASWARRVCDGWWPRVVVTLLTLLAMLGATRGAVAHEAAPGVVALKQVDTTHFLMRWTAASPPVEGLEIRLPEGCQIAERGVFDVDQELAHLPQPLECGQGGLVGSFHFVSQHPSPGRIAVNIEWLDGSETLLLSAGSPATVAVPEQRAQGAWAVLAQYLGLGVEHIWLGIDHLLFLLGLLLLIQGWKSVLLTVSAFTLAHSLTLGLAALELVRVPTGPVEICIALSVLLLAVEATRGDDTLSRRWPWLVAFGFGLLHGLGFAAALSEVGLPGHAVALALLGFNLGVELGQVSVVALVALAHRSIQSRPELRPKVTAIATWVLGTCSVYWVLERIASWLGGLVA